MKLRQKLAAVLAATMIVTAVPVVTMAASSNRITKVVKVAKDDIFNDGTTAPQLVIDLEDNLPANAIFYLELDGAKWSKDAFKDADGNYEAKEVNLATGELTPATASSKIVIKRVSDKEVQVKAQVAIADTENVILPLVAEVTGEQASVTIDTNNQNITGGTYVFAATSNEKGKVTVGTLPNIYSEGSLADITIEEPYQGAFLAKARELEAAGKTHMTLEFDLEHKDFKILDSDSAKVSFGKGFDGQADLTIANGLQIVEGKYSDLLEVKIPTTVFTTDLAAASRGSITISDIAVKSEVKVPEFGDLTVNLSGDILNSADYVVAKVVNYGTSIVMKDEKAVEIVAGRNKEITFTLEENVNDSIVANRTVDFTIENAYFGVMDTASGAQSAINQFKQLIKLPQGAQLVDVEVNDDDEFVGFSVKIAAANLSDTKIDKFEFTTTICTGVALEDQEVVIKATGRAIEGEEPSVVAANVKAPAKVTAEGVVVKVGLQKQVGGKVTISETESAMLERGNLVLSIPAEEGVKFTKKPEVKVTAGDLRLDETGIKIAYNNSSEAYDVVIPVARQSKTASTIEISNFEVTVDRTVPEGTYDLAIAGNALVGSHDNYAVNHSHGAIEVEDFFVIGTRNTEDLASNGLRRGEASFTIGSKKYTVNGEEKEMDAEAYLLNDRTMVPVRYVSDAFGIPGRDILFSNGTVTIFAGTRTVQLTNGSNVAIVNGAQIKLDAKVVIKDGRTYIPMGEVGRILGVSVNWDAATRTATFENN